MTTWEDVLQSIGLWWERLHIFSDDTVQHAGVVSRWTRDLLPVGETEVQPGELVELHVTVPPDLALPESDPPLRFDILEFDWLFWSGSDDPLQSLRTPGAADPVGAFAVLERTLVERPYSDTEITLEAVVGGYRASRPTDFDTSVLVVRDTRNGWKDIVAWWRVPVVDDREPRAYFVAELPGPDTEHMVRDATSVQLRVARAAPPGASVGLHGTIVDSIADAGENPQSVPRARVTLGGRTTTSSADGGYVIEARLGLGDTPLTVARPGIDTRTFTVRLSARAGGGTNVVVLNETGIQSATATIAAGADPTLARLPLNVSALVHRISGTVVWPDTRIVPPAPQPPNPPITLADRYVCALKVDGARVRDQLPQTSREWDQLRQRPDVLRSARPNRPARREATSGDGRFELSFVDLQAGAQYLLWVESTDPADRSRNVPNAVVRTLQIPDMRRAGLAQGANGVVFRPHHDNRRVVASAPLQAGGVGDVVDTVRVLAAGAGGGAPGLRLARPRPTNLRGIEQAPPVDIDETPVDAVARRATGLEVNALPLIPVFEALEHRSLLARGSIERFQSLLETMNPRPWTLPPVPRGMLVAGVRWLLDAERGPTVTAASPAGTWRNAAACQALEHTVLVHPRLGDPNWRNANWRWWRADAVSAADFAEVDLGAGATFAGRSLHWELIPVLAAPSPRLLGLFARRTINLSPGHGLYTNLPPANRNAQNTVFRTQRAEWAGYAQPPAGGQGRYLDNNTMENWGGEDENVVGIAVRLHAVATANGANVISAREVDQTLPGRQMVVDGAGNATFVQVDPAMFPDFPRLWQQNAYYGIGVSYDAALAPANRVVAGLPFTSAAMNNWDPAFDDNPNVLSLNGHGIWSRIELFRKLSSRAASSLDLFVAIHTNADGNPNSRGFFAMYLDVRPTAGSPAPGTPAYVEGNTASSNFAQTLGAEIADAAGIPASGARTRSYWANNGGRVLELAYTTNHFRASAQVQAVRSVVAAGGLTAAPVNPMPRPGGRDVPIGYVELGFHTNPDEAALLGQAWFRGAAADGFAMACEATLRRRPDPVSGADVVALLQSMFGNVPAVAALAGGPNALAAAPTAAQIVDAVERVTGQRPALPGPGLDAVVTAIEDARDGVTRRQLVARITTALALKAGFDVADLDVDVDHPLPAPADAAQADRRRAVAEAVLGPVLVALGARFPDGVVPVIAHLPRPNRSPTRGDAAAVLAAGLGIRPGDLASVTRPVNGFTVLVAAGAPDVPDAYVPTPAIGAAVTAIGSVRPVDVYRLVDVRATDGRGATLVSPLLAGDHVVLTIETAGTAWNVQVPDIEFVLSRPGAGETSLACAIRRVDALITELWQVPATEGTTEFSLTARIKHPNEGIQTLGPVRFSTTIGRRP